MSTLKTTLKVESTTLFPNAIAINSVTNTTDIADSNFGKITVNHETPSYLVTGDIGAKGTFLYLKPSSTNGTQVAINVYGDDSETPIATVYSGDTGFIPVTSTQGKLYAKTTYGTASLEYFVGSRGEDYGQFTLVYSLDSEGPNHKYFVIDANSGVPSKLYDTGFARADYSMGDWSGVQDGGMIFYMSGDGSPDAWFITDKTGAPLLNHNLPTSYEDHWHLEGKGHVWTYEISGGWRVSYFNGNEMYHHDFIGVSWVNVESNWDACSANGTVAVYVQEHNGISNQDAIFLIKDDQKVLISDLNYNDNYFYADASTYTFANYFVVTTFDDDNGYYRKIQIFDTNGNLLKSVDLEAGVYNYMEWDFYGTGHWQTFLYNTGNDSIDYLMFNYNQATGVMIGENLDWTHARGANFPSLDINYNNYYPNGTDSAKNESVAIVFHYEDTNNYDLITPVNLDYLDIHYVIGNATTANKYVLQSDPGTDYWANLNLEFNDNSIQMLKTVGNTATGSLAVVNFTTTGYTTFTVISDLTTRTPDTSWSYYATGDYYLFYYINNSTDKTIYKVISGTTVLDTLTIDNAGETNYRTQQNSIFIRTWGLPGDQKNWYFNTSTKKFVQLPKFYSQRYFANITATNGLEPNYMVLISPDYWRDDNKIAARMLINGIVTNEVILIPDASILTWDGGVSIRLTPQGLMFAYMEIANDYKWVVKFWDHALNSVYTVNTNCKHWQWSDNYQNINMVTFRPVSNSNQYHVFNFGSIINYKKYVLDTYGPNYVINDWNWIN